MITSLAVAAVLSAVPAPSADVDPYDYAQALTDATGVVIEWTDENACGHTLAQEIIGGCYTPLVGIGMVVPEWVTDQPVQWELVNTVLAHEISHHLIWRTCGTTDPDIAGARAEQVTTAYAVEILQADETSARTLAAGTYDWTAEDVEAAHAIAAGNCDNEPIPTPSAQISPMTPEPEPEPAETRMFGPHPEYIR